MQWFSGLSFSDYFFGFAFYIPCLWLGYGLQVEYGFF
jgi:hypothetical protein